MLHLVGASSLYNSIKNLAPVDFIYTGTTHATPSLRLNNRASADYNAFRHLNLPETRNKQIVLWHDLINNSITPHWTNNNLPLTANQLATELRRIPNLHSIIYCHRSGAPDNFQFLLDHLRDLNIIIIDIPKHILSNSEQFDQKLVGSYKRLHQSQDQELRTLAVISYYFPRLDLVFRVRTNTPRP